jgi:hypothetical protein
MEGLSSSQRFFSFDESCHPVVQLALRQFSVFCQISRFDMMEALIFLQKVLSAMLLA